MTDERRPSGDTATQLGNVGVLFGLIAPLPFVETLVFNVHVGSGRPVLSALEYAQLFGIAVILELLMIVSFILTQDTFRSWLTSLAAKLKRTQSALHDNLTYVLLILPLLFVAVLFGGSDALRLLIKWDVLSTVLLPAISLGIVVFLLWLIARLLKALGSHYPDLKGAMDEWSFALKTSLVFYILLVAASIRFIRLAGIDERTRLDFTLAIGKDYLLLFIIASMLYGGLYKVARANSLRALFQTDKGFLYFMLVCAIIAILAVWADFNGMSAANRGDVFPYDWQRRYNTIHIYLRDIGLLLMPIGGLLFWSLLRVANEERVSRTKEARDQGRA